MLSESIEKRLSLLANTIQEAESEAEKIKTMLLLFPDLEVNIDRWKNVKYTSQMVNTMATEYTTGYSCGCCSDSPYFIYPYVEFEGIRVHSKPARFYIGERCDYVEDGIWYETDCLKTLKEYNLTKEIIAKVENLVNRPPSYLDNDDDVSDEAEGDT